MSYIYSNVSDLENKPKVGTLQCVALIRHYTKAPPSSTWKQGAAVMGNATIRKGTAIATFIKGRYPNMTTGNHAAFFMGFSTDGIVVMDQWKNNREKPMISSRVIRATKGGKVSNNANAYSIIE